MVYEHYDIAIKKLNRRVEELQKEIDSLRNEIFTKSLERNLYNTSSTADENTEYTELDIDYTKENIT